MKEGESHAGRYTSKRSAEEWRAELQSQGLVAVVVPVTCWDVIIVRKQE